MSLLAELRRRNVIRMAGLYLVGAWLLVQVAGTVLPMFGAPDWLARSMVIILAIGFVPTLAFSWVFELTPEGLKRDADVPPEQSIAAHTAQRMNRLLIATLVLALTYFAIDKFVLAPARETAQATQMAKVNAQQQAAKADVQAFNAKSIAVLPFTDFSPAHDQEYFSDGMSEEILNALAQVKDLKVAGRTSSFYYKGRNEDLRSIGKALDVANVLEGSVRKQGDKVRITAQLVRTKDGFHLWSETYDGDLKDVFALQEKIARAITDKLQVVLSGQQTTRLVNAGTENTEAYALYLQASATFNRRDGGHFPNAVSLLQEALRLDPKFARAHARLAALYAIAPAYGARLADDMAEAAATQAQLAIDLDPTLAEPHAALGLVYSTQRRSIEARKAFEHALAIEGNDITANTWLATNLYSTGYLKSSSDTFDKVLAIDPMLPIAQLWRGMSHVQFGDIDQAQRLLSRADESGLAHAGLGLSMVTAARGDRSGAAAQLARGLQPFMHDFPAGGPRTVAEGIFGDAQARAKAIAMFDSYLATRPAEIAGVVPYSLIRLGQPVRAFALAGDKPTSNDPLILSTIWTPAGRDARRLPEFSAFVRRAKLAELWDQYGAPDLCRKNDKGDYLCE